MDNSWQQLHKACCAEQLVNQHNAAYYEKQHTPELAAYYTMFNFTGQKYYCLNVLFSLAIMVLLGCYSLSQAATKNVNQEVSIQLRGVTGEVRENILNNLSLNQEKQSTKINSARIRRLFSQSDKEILLALQPFGYFNPTVPHINFLHPCIYCN